MKDGLNRRDVLKLSMAAGVTLAAGNITRIAETATFDKSLPISLNVPAFLDQHIAST